MGRFDDWKNELGRAREGLHGAVGESIELRDGDDSICRRAGRILGVGGTTSGILEEKELSNEGVCIVRFGGFRRKDLVLSCMGDAGAEILGVFPLMGAVAMA